jgi:hypothetical protein
VLVGCGSDWKSDDLDGDGYTVEDGDCWESSEPLAGSGLTGADIFPGAEDVPFDGIDADCGGNDDFDLDGDGWVELEEHLGAVTTGVPGSGEHFGFGDCQNAAGGVQTALNGFTDLDHALIHPDAADDFYDGIDANCDGADDFDADLDGEGSADFVGLSGEVGTDCDDADSAIYSGAEEICDGVDNDCDLLLDIDDPDLDPAAYATYYSDIDGDGYGDDATAEASCEVVPGAVLLGGDCDDLSPDVNPGASEVCDGIDNDCDALLDDTDDSLDPASAAAWYPDADGDTYGALDGLLLLCAAPDGAYVANPDDCDDSLAGVNPAATEVCDGIDNDCDAFADDLDDNLDLTTRSDFFADADSDGFGDPGALQQACAAPVGTVVDNTDCDDTLAAVNPAASEVCNDGRDDDCDGLSDDADASLDLSSRSAFFQDNDSDTYGSAVRLDACAAPVGYVDRGGDCDDVRAAVNPAATEVCNSLDADCDGAADDADPGVSYSVADRWFADADADTYGNAAVRLDACVQPAAYVANATDCNDASAAINPAAAEVCDSGIDNDCDGLADDADTFVVPSTRGFWYRDNDSDGYGAGVVVRACAAPVGRVASNTDCNDAVAAINPGAIEICDGGIDNNCAGGADDADPSVDRSTTGTDFYIDADGDLFGDGSLASLRRCAAPVGRVADATDCDDTRLAVNPDADEVCNDGLDNDCDTTLGTTAGGDTCEPADGAVDLVAQRSFTGEGGSVAGATLSIGGDLGVDGIDDLVVSSPEHPTTGATGLRFRGLVTVVAGSAGWALTDNTAATLASAAFVSFEGVSGTDRLGYATSVGDFDGDGAVELFLGAPGVGAATDTPLDRGAVYLIDGGLSAAGLVTVPTTNARAGTIASQYLGGSIAANGTADLDARDDVLLGAPECASAVIGMGSAVSTNPGRALLIGGAAALSDFGTAAARVTFVGDENNACAGSSVLWADLDGDGVDEAIIGEQNRDFGALADAGRVYVADAGLTGTVLLSSLPFLRGVEAADRLGQYMAAGDLDGDGLDDLVLGEAKDGVDRGAVFLISGDAFPAISASPESVASTTLLGAADSDFFGTSLAVVGDMDGAPDGLPELLIGAQRASGTDVGAAYLLSGGLMGLGSLNISAAADYTFTGATANGYLGTAAAAGDLNGDGVPDLAIGAARGSGDLDGTVRVVLGLGY